jgi:hypothetical protein
MAATKKKAAKAPAKTGRPLKEISANQVKSLAEIGCTNIEIATVCGCSVDTLERRFADIIKKGRETMKSSLRRFQYTSAKSGSVPMQIWMGKQYLGQRDKNDVTSDGKPLIDDQERAKAAIELLMERIGCSREVAAKELAPFMPEVSKLVH